MAQNVKYSSEKLLLDRSKTFWAGPKQFGRIQNCFGVIKGLACQLCSKFDKKTDCTNSQLIQSSKFIGSCQKAMMTVDFTPIFLSLLPLFLATGTLLGLALQNAETSSTSTTPNIR